ncbi:hypothetical protein TSTA_066310 [Talaromyces stipitatus ATCC 10500]|uniref:RelA/SpoT domain-containing protein n=1 Tax=Talaromyces stipitatus (strain ATCC 10500 / CBS 375.48 / QM 6759 / NRRL 1006) TaxID=441959 RepID=B8LXA0_TALSN|nr:uncharacterized protein TSTA_066310 [Talaromyces stipitatus ATCC 10500]EED23181.1 hypothetical protein TSTA_066310 [Talaromyces stipitatus ATCC 10500]
MDYTGENDNWELFHNHFHLRVDTARAYTEEVRKLCSNALEASNIHFPPITSRIKSWQSAKGSVSRRNRERVIRRHIRDLVESQGRRWEDYTRETGFSLYGEETEPFKSPEEMFSALHDFGGDIERVAAVINRQFTVIRQIEKGHGPPSNVQSLEDRLDLLQNSERRTQAAINTSVLQRSMRTFTGYKATHFVVKLRDEHIQECDKHAWKDIVVEIQVGTLVMHVWSEIEHDMIYKPLDSQDGAVSEDEKRILDLINGIVLTGEAALRQLEASTAQRLNKRAEDENAMASSHYELATWIEKYFKEQKLSFEGPGSEWKNLERLFAVLKLTGSQKHSKVTELIEDATQRTRNRHYLPTEMLWALCKESTTSEWPAINNNTSEDTIAKKARLWALRLVHSLNLAIYFGVAEEFLCVEALPSAPSITSLLDILHPEQPQYTSNEAAQKIKKLCKAIVSSEHRRPEPLNNLVKVAMNLPVKHLVGGFTEGTACIFPIPAIITRLFPLEATTEENASSETDELFQILDLIDLSMSSHGDPNNFMVIWDLVTPESMNVTERKPIKSRFFVPVMSPEDKFFGHWELVDQDLNIGIMNPSDIGKSARLLEQFEIPEHVLRLAYRLHPEQAWHRLGEAWGIIKPLLRRRRSAGSGVEHRLPEAPGARTWASARIERPQQGNNTFSSKMGKTITLQPQNVKGDDVPTLLTGWDGY